MRGNEKVIEQLNQALHGELTAVVQYIVQSELCQNWGYARLGDLTKRRAIEEMTHAEGIIERLVFLDSSPIVNLSLAPKIGGTVQQQLELGLADETAAAREYNEAARICADQGDAGTKDLFERMLHDEERHADFLEAQLHAIKEMGAGPYLGQQLTPQK